MDMLVAGAVRQWRAGQWLADGSLDAVAEINLQCLQYLPVMQGVAEAVRVRLAASPYLLADAGFDDEPRWRGVGQRMVQDLPAQLAEPVFTGAGSADFIRRVLVFGWHLARANRQLARVVLGMSPVCADRVATLRLHDLDWLAEHRPGWVRPRWERQPRVWRHLLHAAGDAEAGRLTQASLRGLQWLAAGVISLPGGMPQRARRS